MLGLMSYKLESRLPEEISTILGISELKWMGMCEFIPMTIISTTMDKNPIEEME